MDASNFSNSIRELKMTLMAEGITAVNIATLNEGLQYAIQNNRVEDSEVRALLLALDYFKDSLPYYTILQIDLINKLFLYGNVLLSMNGQVDTNGATKSIAACCGNDDDDEPVVMPIHMNANKMIGDNRGDIDPARDLTPAKIAETAGMIHKEVSMDPSTRTKTIVTYEHQKDGTLKKLNTEILTEPAEDDIFANILGDSFVKDESSSAVSADDL